MDFTQEYTEKFNQTEEQDLDRRRRARAQLEVVSIFTPARTIADIITTSQGAGIHRRHRGATTRIMYLGIAAFAVFVAWALSIFLYNLA